MSKFKDFKFIGSLVATAIGLLLSTHIVGSGTLSQALGIVLVLLSDLGIQALNVQSPAQTPPAN
jgi:hypothetical protein